VDNLIRPIVISGATKIPFIIIFIGVLGGLTAFGFVGLFIGPVVLAIGLAVWREWISQHKNEIFAPQDVTLSDSNAIAPVHNPAQDTVSGNEST
jgi:predicted PurR-regulated permease PerM